MTSEPIQTMIKKQVKPAVVIFLLLTILLGFVYPLVVTGIAQVIFPVQSNGNIFEHNGNVVGSSLVGQPFSSAKYFWGRPSATSSFPYNAGASSGSNLGPNNPALIDAVKTRVDALHAADPGNTKLIPVDLVTASGSGLDPDISIAAADYQVSRIARERNLNEQDVQTLVTENIQPRQFGIFGEPHVNVLSLNLALDDLSSGRISEPLQTSLSPDQIQQTTQPTVFGMRGSDWLQLIVFILIVAFLVVPLGAWMAKVFTGQSNFLSPVFEFIERKFLCSRRDKRKRGNGLETVCCCPHGIFHPLHPFCVVPAAYSAIPSAKPCWFRGCAMGPLPEYRGEFCH